MRLRNTSSGSVVKLLEFKVESPQIRETAEHTLWQRRQRVRTNIENLQIRETVEITRLQTRNASAIKI